MYGNNDTDNAGPGEDILRHVVAAGPALAGRVADRSWRALELTRLALGRHRPATTRFDLAAQGVLFDGPDKRERMTPVPH